MDPLPRSNITSEHELCLSFLNDVVELMRLLMKCLFLFLNCHKPMDGPVTSPISPKTVNPSGEHYHWSIPHRSLLRWLCLPAQCWSLIYSPCLRAPRAEPHSDLRNEGMAIPASHPSLSGLVSLWTWMPWISENPTFYLSRSISIPEWQIPFIIHGRHPWQWLTWVSVYIMAATYYYEMQN